MISPSDETSMVNSSLFINNGELGVNPNSNWVGLNLQFTIKSTMTS